VRVPPSSAGFGHAARSTDSVSPTSTLRGLDPVTNSSASSYGSWCVVFRFHHSPPLLTRCCAVSAASTERMRPDRVLVPDTLVPGLASHCPAPSRCSILLQRCCPPYALAWSCSQCHSCERPVPAPFRPTRDYGHAGRRPCTRRDTATSTAVRTDIITNACPRIVPCRTGDRSPEWHLITSAFTADRMRTRALPACVRSA
jgi:hypothetical protein